MSDRGGYRPTSQHASDAVAQFARAVDSSTSPNTGAVLLNVEGVGGLDGAEDGKGEGSVGVEFYGALGIVARPLPPDTVGGKDRHAEVVCLRTADGLVPVATRDVRLNQSFPNPKAGDVVLAGYGSNFVKLAADGDLYVATTTDGTPTGMLVQIQHRKDGFAYVAPWGKLTYDVGGLHALHSSGARLDLGGIGGLPVPGLGSYAVLSAAVLKLECSTCAIGPAAGVPDNVVKATPLEVLLGLLGVAVAALGAVPSNAAASAACTAAATAITAALLPPPGSAPTSIRAQNLTVSG